ncbi:hypothetical protein PG999_001335 [Apiospora kogelbergensis]|uniref:BTB domain-containing protein n=1 Tax=Apiospora kogelbergensis TaxID=1337665 RepID=A0AAW0RED2_9PEZI
MVSRSKRGRKIKSETTSSDEPLPDIENIDPNGDLVLVVGADLVGYGSSLFTAKKTVAFRVDYKALTRASSVFKAMFDANSDDYKPGASDAGWTEHLPVDSPTGLRFLFLVAHAEVSKLPEGHSFQQVYEIIHMAESYDMVPLLKISARSWFFTGRPDPASLRGSFVRRTYFERSPFQRLPLQLTLSDQTNAETLLKAYTIGLSLGNRSLINEVSKHIVQRSRIVDGHLWCEGKDLESFDLCFEVQWLEFWKASRRDILGGMVSSLKSFIDQLQGTDWYTEYCPHHGGQNMKGKLCAALALGSLIQGLAEKGDWPLPDPENMDERTVRRVEASWSSIDLNGFSDTVEPCIRDHDCDWSAVLKERIHEAAAKPCVFKPVWYQQRVELLGLVDL